LLPGFGQRGQHGGFTGGQPEVRPPEPVRFPGNGGRPTAEEVDAEGRTGAVGQGSAETPARTSRPEGRRKIPGAVWSHISPNAGSYASGRWTAEPARRSRDCAGVPAGSQETTRRDRDILQ
jgi:hypothetical protein